MVDINTVDFLGRTGTKLGRISGASLTIGVLSNPTTITDAAFVFNVNDAGTSSFTLRNNTAGQVCDLNVDGGISAGNAIASQGQVSGTGLAITSGANALVFAAVPTAVRLQTFPDISGDILVASAPGDTVTHATALVFDITSAGKSNASIINSTAGQTCDLTVDGSILSGDSLAFRVAAGVQFSLTGTPTGLRTITCIDADLSLRHRGNFTVATLPVLAAGDAGDTAFATDGRAIAGTVSGGGTVVDVEAAPGSGALVAWNGAAWCLAGTAMVVTA